MKKIKPDQIDVIIGNSKKPPSYSNFPFQLNSLDDRVFEVMTYSLFKQRIENNFNNLSKQFDNIELMQGVGEKGMDSILLKDGKIKGIIQCKRYAKNVSDKTILQEIIKITLHSLLDPSSLTIKKGFKYYFVASTGYTGNALILFNTEQIKKVGTMPEFEQLIESVISKYKVFKSIDISKNKNAIISTILKLKFELIKPSDLSLWLNTHPEVRDTFFETRKVTDTIVIEKKGDEIIKTVKKLMNKREDESMRVFLNNYRKICIEKLNLINFIGFDLQKYRQKPNEITLTELFVQPTFRQHISEKSELLTNVINKEFRIANVFKSEKHLVILGDPGAGKSLLVKYIMVQLLEQIADKIGLANYSKTIPFRIELRKYNDVRDQKSILEYLSDLLTKEYQTKISETLLTKITTGLPTIFFFDGLDEIFNVSHKTKMKELIESFSLNFPNVKSVVTSRFIGYHDIKFNPKKFVEFGILRFNEDQVEELVRKFYLTQSQNPEKRKIQIELCLNQLKRDVDPDLKTNPLILTLILILASNNIIIPDSKLEIYESCTKTLVDTIDLREKELHFDIPVKNKRLTFAHLAYWQYESISNNQEINYIRALKSIANLLMERNEAQDYPEAEEKAKKFLEYAERRSIYFEDNFTHKTFLEYYTADFLYINYFTKARDSERQKLIDIILRYLPNPFWYIVFELLLTRIDKEQSDNEVLDEIFEKLIEINSINVYFFLVSNLSKFINASNTVKKKIVYNTISSCINGEKVTTKKKSTYFEEYSLIYKICMLQNNRESSQLLQEVFDKIESERGTETEKISFYQFYFELASLNRFELVTFPIKLSSDVKVKKLAYKDLYLYSNVFVGRIPDNVLDRSILIDQIEYFGVRSLFNDIKLKYRKNTRRINSFDIYLIGFIETLSFERLKEDFYALQEYGLSLELILPHAKSNRTFFFQRSEGFEKLLRFYLKSNDSNIDKIIIALMDLKLDKKPMYESFRTKFNNPKLKYIDSLFASLSQSS